MSVNTISNIDREGYVEEFKVDYEREKSLLQKCTMPATLVKADTVVWEVVDQTDAAQEKTRDGKIPVSNLDFSRVTASPKREYKKYQIDDFDAFKHNSNVRSMQNRKAVAACHRAIDQLIFDQLDTATTVVNSGSAISFSTYANILAWISTIENNDVPSNDGKLWGVVTPTQLRQMMRINEFTSADYIGDRKLENGLPADGGYYRWLGVNWFSHTGLTGKGTSTASNFLFHTTALGHQTLGDPDAYVGWNDEDDFWFNWAKVSHAAKLCLQNGVVKAVGNDSVSFS